MDLTEKIEKALDKIRPALRMDGGEVEFVEYDQETGVVSLRMVGACGGCPMSMLTLKMGIERAIRQEVPEVKSVQAI